MKKNIIRSFILFILILVLPGILPKIHKTINAQRMKGSPQFWYEDNNVRQAGGFPPDFKEMFMKPEKWARLRKYIDVYYIRGNTFQKVLDKYGLDFIKDHFIKVLNDDNISIALDNTHKWGKNIKILREYGAKVTHISLQSILSKYSINRRKYKGYEHDPEIKRRIDQAITRVIEIKKMYKDIKVGIIDATPSKAREYKKPYTAVVNGLKAKGYKLDYIHLDCPINIIGKGKQITWEKIKEVEQFVQTELKIRFGFVCTSSMGGRESDEKFYTQVMKIPDRYIATNGLPDHFIIMSWFEHPKKSLPDNAPMEQYTMTKTAWHLAHKLQKLWK